MPTILNSLQNWRNYYARIKPCSIDWLFGERPRKQIHTHRKEGDAVQCRHQQPLEEQGSDSKEYTEWVNIEAWGRLGEICHEYLKKGSLVFVEGRLKTDRYEDKDEQHYFTKVVTQYTQFLSDNRVDYPEAEQEDLSVL
jgi:single stranded DNA-binding protein